MPATVAWPVNAGLATGAVPTTTFPNEHLIRPRASSWSAPQAGSPLQELVQAIKDEDWTHNFEEGLTTIGMRADWSATPERCNFLKVVASSSQARRVLEIGSFCGVAALSLAESLPEEGQVHTIEIDPFVVKFGERFRAKSLSGRKITTHVGPAMESLQKLAQQVREGALAPFDFAIVDADKAGMRGYLDLLWDSGLVSEHAVVCVDLTPFKGQPPLRYVKYGFPYTWEASSGQKEIDELRAHVVASSRFVSHEAGQILVVQRVLNMA